VDDRFGSGRRKSSEGSFADFRNLGGGPQGPKAPWARPGVLRADFSHPPFPRLGVAVSLLAGAPGFETRAVKKKGVGPFTVFENCPAAGAGGHSGPDDNRLGPGPSPGPSHFRLDGAGGKGPPRGGGFFFFSTPVCFRWGRGVFRAKGRGTLGDGGRKGNNPGRSFCFSHAWLGFPQGRGGGRIFLRWRVLTVDGKTKLRSQGSV